MDIAEASTGLTKCFWKCLQTGLHNYYLPVHYMPKHIMEHVLIISDSDGVMTGSMTWCAVCILINAVAPSSVHIMNDDFVKE